MKISSAFHSPGFRFQSEAELAKYTELERKMLAIFGRYGYRSVSTPVVEESEYFLERSGEQIRSKMYIFQDPRGREICLRPELTIPVSNYFLRFLGCPEGSHRLAYSGPVFRYERNTGKSRLRQFHQTGVEFFGEEDRIYADAETLGLAHRTVRELGLSFQLKAGDLGIVREFFNGLPVPEFIKQKLTMLYSVPEYFKIYLGQLTEGMGETTVISSPADSRYFLGVRSAADILKRNEEREWIAANPLSKDLILGIQKFLEVRGKASEFTSEISQFCDTPSFHRRIENFRRTIDLLSHFGVSEEEIEFSSTFRRGIEYYTDFIFEIHHASPSIGQICGGGRYDGLLHKLGAPREIPATGFTYGLDRLALAFPEENAPSPSPDVLLCSLNDSKDTFAVRAAETLRDLGLAVLFEPNLRKPRKALGRCLSLGIPFCVFVGEEEADQEVITAKNLAKEEQRKLNLTDVSTLNHFFRKNV